MSFTVSCRPSLTTTMSSTTTTTVCDRSVFSPAIPRPSSPTTTTTVQARSVSTSAIPIPSFTSTTITPVRDRSVSTPTIPIPPSDMDCTTIKLRSCSTTKPNLSFASTTTTTRSFTAATTSSSISTTSTRTRHSLVSTTIPSTITRHSSTTTTPRLRHSINTTRPKSFITTATTTKSRFSTTAKPRPSTTTTAKPILSTNSARPTPSTTTASIPTTKPRSSATTTKLRLSTTTAKPKLSTNTNSPRPSTTTTSTPTTKPRLSTNSPRLSATTTTTSTPTTKPRLSTNTNSPRPSTTTNSLRSSTTTNGPRPSTTTNSPRPTTTNSPRPSTTTNGPRPSTTTNSPRPSTTTNSLRSSTTTNGPRPSTTTNSPRPSTTTNSPRPSTTTNRPRPSTITTKPRLSTTTTKPRLSTTTTARPNPSTTTTTKLRLFTTTTTTPIGPPTTTTTPIRSSGSTTRPSTKASINNGCKLVKLLDGCGKRVMYQVFRWGTPDKDPNTDLITYLKNLPPTSTASYPTLTNRQRSFNNIQEQQISRDTTGESYDISLLFLVIKLSCEGVAEPTNPVWYTAGPDLEYLVCQIKNERNEVFHGELMMTEVEFLDKARRLSQLLIKTLTAAQTRYKLSVKVRNKEILRVNSDIHEIINEPFGMDEILKHCESELLKSLLTEATKFLKDITKKETYLDIMYFLSGIRVRIYVENIFTEIKVVSGRLGAETIKYTDLLTVAEGGSAQVQRGSRPQVVVVEALAGGGKTTLVTLVTAEWRQGGYGSLKGLHQYQLLLRVQCRDSHLTSLTDMLNHLLPQASLKYRDLLPKLIKKFHILTVIDGLDERNAMSHRLVTDLLDQFQDSPNCTLFCTTRPEALKDFLDSVPSKYDVTHVKLVGIPVKLRTKFVITYFEEIVKISSTQQPSSSHLATQPSLTDKVKELVIIMEREKNKEYNRTPLMLTIISWLFYFDPEKLNKTSTHTELISLCHQLCQEKLDHRLAINNITKNMIYRERQNKVQSWLLIMYQKVMEALSNNKLTLPKRTVDHLTNECNKLTLPTNEMMAAFLCMKTSWTSIHQYQEEYRAPHKTFQELYSAMYIVLTLKEQALPSSTDNEIENIMKKVCGTDTVNWSKYQNLLQQVAGLLHLQLDNDDPKLAVVSREVVELLHKSGVNNREQWLDVIEDTAAGTPILMSIAKYFPTSEEIEITDGRVNSYAQLLLHLAPTQVKVDLKGDPTILLPSLLRHSITELELWHHYYHPNATSPPPQHIMNQLLSRNDLTKFVGQLSVSQLPDTLTHLLVSVRDNYQASLLPDLYNLTHLVQLNVHMSHQVSLSAVTRSLPCVTGIHGGFNEAYLYLSDVTTEGPAIKMAARLQPQCGYYKQLYFPRTHLDVDGWRRVVEMMVKEGVRVERIIIPCVSIIKTTPTPSTIPTATATPTATANEWLRSTGLETARPDSLGNHNTSTASTTTTSTTATTTTTTPTTATMTPQQLAELISFARNELRCSFIRDPTGMLAHFEDV